MLGWMDDEALHRTLTTGRCTYWSRSRQEYWVKGDTSGHFQHVKSVALDCDADTVLVKVDQVGAACHTGARTCFDADVLKAVGPAPIPAYRHWISKVSRHGPRDVPQAGRRPPCHPRQPQAARRRRHPGRALPQARRRAPRHLPAGVRRERPLLVPLLLRRRPQRRHPHRARRPGPLARHPARRRPRRRRPARALRATVETLHTPRDLARALPPFTGGMVGYLGYDIVRRLEKIGPGERDDLRLPELTMLLTWTSPSWTTGTAPSC